MNDPPCLSRSSNSVRFHKAVNPSMLKFLGFEHFDCYKFNFFGVLMLLY